MSEEVGVGEPGVVYVKILEDYLFSEKADQVSFGGGSSVANLLV